MEDFHTSICRLIETSFPHQPSREALVVSVYGEWGVGKTRTLRNIEGYFRDLSAKPGDYFYIPVFFSPWRYEREEHLIVPLLKTIEQVVKTTQPPYRAIKKGLNKSTKIFADFAIAVAAGIKFKFGLPGAALEVNGKSMLDKARNTRANQCDSLYYGAFKQLDTLGLDETLRFVVLIDDLDRCLPEKAVEMLESIKLFLNLKNFSFVLAVDEEVVERGINHRYRDYLFSRPQGDDGKPEEPDAFAPPISGSEYLEKIVHVPVYLPLWSKKSAQKFLTDTFEDFFSLTDVKLTEQTNQDEKHRTDLALKPEQSTEKQTDEALLNLFLDALPPVPRKLIRAVEGTRLKVDRLRQLGGQDISTLLVARLTILQQLYPALYRLLRNEAKVYGWLLSTELDENNALDISDIKAALNQGGGASRRGGRFLPRYQAAIRQGINNRYGVHPQDIFPDLPEQSDYDIYHGVSPEIFRQLYLQERSPEIEISESPNYQETDIPEASDGNLPLAKLNVPMLVVVEGLLNPTTAARSAFIKEHKLANNRLPDNCFKALLAANKAKDRATDLSWLAHMAEVTSADQFKTLYKQLNVIAELAKQEVPHD